MLDGGHDGEEAERVVDVVRDRVDGAKPRLLGRRAGLLGRVLGRGRCGEARRRLAEPDCADRSKTIRGRTSRWCCFGDEEGGGSGDADAEARRAIRLAVERAAWLTGLSPAHAEAAQVTRNVLLLWRRRWRRGRAR